MLGRVKISRRIPYVGVAEEELRCRVCAAHDFDSDGEAARGASSIPVKNFMDGRTSPSETARRCSAANVRESLGESLQSALPSQVLAPLPSLKESRFNQL